MFDNLNTTLVNFAKEVVRLEKRNLNLTGFSKKNRKINNTKNLSRGLGYRIDKGKSFFKITFTSKEDYALFVDQGVNGLEVQYQAPFSYKKEFANIGEIKKYVKSNKIKLRRVYVNKAGQKVNEFIPKNKKNIDTAAFLMARSIAKKGLKPTLFFESAFEEAFKQLPNEAAKAISDDMANIFANSFKNNSNINVTEID